jgi:short subunit dehydrogenase-like uncharacterized protein
MADWLIYGATGYTGQLVAEAAVRRGHRPLLAGRSAERLRPLAERLNLDYAALPLEDAGGLAKLVSGVQAVYHAAGPFAITSEPMLRACLAAGAHYLDITGEIGVYQQVFSHSPAAVEKGIALLPGVGFDVIPSDCLLKYVADQLPDATALIVAIDGIGPSGGSSASAGTLKSGLEILAHTGSVVRRNGQLVRHPLGAGVKQFRFPHGQRAAMPFPWGDVEMAWRSTGVPNITAYLGFPPGQMRAARLGGGLATLLLKSSALRRFIGRQIDRQVTGPSEHAREQGRSYLYAQARNERGDTREAWLETPEAYRFTAEVAPLVVERVLDGGLRGALTPSLAFGADFPLAVAGTRRWDTLPDKP